MSKPVYLQLPTLKLIKIVMYEFWYDYIKPKYGEKAKLCYVDTDSFIVYTKADDICEDIAEDIETRSDTSNYELIRSQPKGNNKKFIDVMKGELGGRIMNEFVALNRKKCVLKKN